MAHEQHDSDRIHAEDLALDIGGGAGALLIYTRSDLREKEIEVSRRGESKRVHTQIHERLINGRTVFAGVFPELAPGRYVIWSEVPRPVTEVTIAEGEVAEVDWR